MRTTTDSSLTARALRETEALARELVVAASSSNDPSAALLAACNALEIRMDETAASYVARHVNDADTGTTGANKLAFAALSINRGSAVYKMLVHVAEVTFHRTANVLQPFVEAEDLFDELRMRAWRLPAQQFSEDGILRDPGLMGYLATVARRLAIDHCRRLTARHRRNESWGAEH